MTINILFITLNMQTHKRLQLFTLFKSSKTDRGDIILKK